MASEWTRREFVIAGSAVALAPTLATARGRLRRSKAAELRVGLVGCGGRGVTVARQALAADPGVTIWAAADAFADRLAGGLDRLAKEAGEAEAGRVQVAADRRFVGLDGYRGLLDSGVDVVLLTTPPQFRPAHIKAAVERGKHVFAETAVAVDAPGVRSVLASAEAAKGRHLALQTGFCWRYSRAEREAFAKLHSGVIGPVVTVYSTYHGGTLPTYPRQAAWTDLEWQLRNWLHFTWLSGDHVVEQAVHSIDRLRWAMNEALPVRATALGGRVARTGPESGNIFDHFTVVYEYADGRRGFHTCRQIDGCPRDNSDYVYGAAGAGVINGWGNKRAFSDAAGKPLWSYEGTGNDFYQDEQNEFFSSIRAGKPNNDGERAATSTMMAIMGRVAAYTGQTVNWDDAMNSAESLAPEKLEFGPLPASPVAVPGTRKPS